MYLTTKNKIIIGTIILLLISFLAYKYFWTEEPLEFDIESTDIGLEVAPAAIIEEEEIIMVDVKGAVTSPGVYRMNEEDRVIDAIEKAGGPTEDADLDQINLAEKVYDELKIQVPKKGEELTANSNSISNGKININRASVSELLTLAGIGETKAQAIIKYREENGKFSSIEEIMNVTGIAEKTFEQIRNDITI